MGDVFLPERIDEAGDISRVGVTVVRDEMALEGPAVNRHITIAQAQAAVHQLDEDLARRALAMTLEPLDEPFVERAG